MVSQAGRSVAAPSKSAGCLAALPRTETVQSVGTKGRLGMFFAAKRAGTLCRPFSFSYSSNSYQSF